MRWITCLLLLCAMNLPAFAAEPQTLDLFSAVGGQPEKNAAIDGNASIPKPHYTNEPFEEPFTADTAHGYLGAASFLAAVLAGITAPNNGDNPALRGQPAKKGFHHYAGLTAAALGGAAVISGFWQHSEDIEADPLDPDTMHMLLGVLATAGYAWAVSKGPTTIGLGSGSHAAAGITGAALMATALYLEF